ncbi:hypothetical protein [Nitratireductor indicus]|uniref:hypothetical protein n=1 Tax=Nitratireductor indicus TaxID=721133 RepID=UPI002873F565|nr:hypothetical protein [Nitratireductor indicus]MDS1137190.1 hypothetical protein [Nitratireductor indicus]
MAVLLGRSSINAPVQVQAAPRQPSIKSGYEMVALPHGLWLKIFEAQIDGRRSASMWNAERFTCGNRHGNSSTGLENRNPVIGYLFRYRPKGEGARVTFGTKTAIQLAQTDTNVILQSVRQLRTPGKSSPLSDILNRGYFLNSNTHERILNILATQRNQHQKYTIALCYINL